MPGVDVECRRGNIRPEVSLTGATAFARESAKDRGYQSGPRRVIPTSDKAAPKASKELHLVVPRAYLTVFQLLAVHHCWNCLHRRAYSGVRIFFGTGASRALAATRHQVRKTTYASELMHGETLQASLRTRSP